MNNSVYPMPNGMMNDPALNMTNNSNDHYFENLMRSNVGKVATIEVSYPDSVENRDKSYTGVLQDIGRDYITISTDRGEWYVIMMVYVNDVRFDSPINRF